MTFGWPSSTTAATVRRNSPVWLAGHTLPGRNIRFSIFPSFIPHTLPFLRHGSLRSTAQSRATQAFNMIRTLPRSLRLRPTVAPVRARVLHSAAARPSLAASNLSDKKQYATEAPSPSSNDLFASGGNTYYAEE